MLFAYVQDLDPLNSPVASTVLALLPVATLFYLLVGRRWLASGAGAAGAIVAVLLAWLVYGMPLEMAGWSFVHGAAFGLLPIGWTVFAAMFLYNVTVETGQFAIIRRSVGSLSGDARVQAVLVGFAFGALMEGAAGAGSPVAICGAMLVGLGFPPFKAAVLCLIANTSPVAYGGLGVPILTLGSSSGIAADTLSVMAGHQLPILSCLVPLYMVKCMGTWRQTFAVLPVLVVAGGSFAVAQYLFATLHYTVPGAPAIWPLTDVGGAIIALVVTAVFLKFWRPRHEWHFVSLPPNRHTPPAPVPHDPTADHAREEVASLLGNEPQAAQEAPLTFGSVALAWSPFLIMTVLLAVFGILREAENARKRPLDLGFTTSYYEMPVPTLHREVLRAERLRKPGATEDESREDARFKITWLTAPGTPVLLSALISMVILRTNRRQLAAIVRRTAVQMKVPIPTIACMLGLSYVTKYAGIDATLGIAFAGTGVLYPFFAAMLGWLGVFLTGTDAGSNALFGSLQKITATEVWNAHHTGAFNHLTLEQSQVLICTANSTGGVMGKMIDAQSICVATAATHQLGKEADIFKAVIWHSVFLACIVGLLTTVQAYLWPFTLMVPHP